MKILQVAPWEETVPPKKYGGTELVVSNVTEGLVKQGHQVYLIASGNSTTSANLIPITPTSLREMFSVTEIDKWRDYYKIYGVGQVLRIIKNLKPDIVHNHLNWRLVLFSQLIDCPMITTLHGPITSHYERETYSRFPDTNFISISDNQRKAMPNLNWVKTVYNGIDTSKFNLGKGQGGYFAFLGRTSPEKGLLEVCQAVKKTNYKLKIGAKVDSVDKEFFETKIKPLIDGTQIEFLGEVDHAGKSKLLENATGLLFWLNWEEPFGLAVTEAMACGTPVIVNPRGSMPELIKDGETGIFIHSQEEMIKAMDQIKQLDRAKTREHVVKNFSVERMVDDYQSVMESLVAKHQYGPSPDLVLTSPNQAPIAYAHTIKR